MFLSSFYPFAETIQTREKYLDCVHRFISEADSVVPEHVCQHDTKQGVGMSDKFPVVSQLRPITAKQSNSDHMVQKKVAPFIVSLRERIPFVLHIPVCNLDFFLIYAFGRGNPASANSNRAVLQ